MAKYKRKNTAKPRRSKLLTALNVMIGIALALVLMAVIATLSDNLGSYYNRKFDESYSYYSLQNGDYAQLVEDYYDNWGIFGEIKSGSEELAAVADYADAAFRLSACEREGTADGRSIVDDSILTGLRERMEKDREQMGVYLPEADKIDGMLR